MISILHYSFNRCCKSDSALWAKSTYLKSYSPKIDMVAGLILSLISTLALFGLIPMPVAISMMIVANVQFGVGFFIFIRENCIKGLKGLILNKMQGGDGLHLSPSELLEHN